MKIYDISMPIHAGMLVWPGDPGPVIEQKTSVEKDGVMLSHVSFGTHTGTHIDAPSHFIAGGKSLEQVPLEKLVGSCLVIDLEAIGHQEITVSDISSAHTRCGLATTHKELPKRLLLKTGNYKLLANNIFSNMYISLSLEAAEYLVKQGIELVGTDFLGIEKKSSPGHPVHTALLQAGVVIVEGLDLSDVPAGEYELVCLPLKLIGVDGSPCRAILIADKKSKIKNQKQMQK